MTDLHHVVFMYLLIICPTSWYWALVGGNCGFDRRAINYPTACDQIGGPISPPLPTINNKAQLIIFDNT